MTLAGGDVEHHEAQGEGEQQLDDERCHQGSSRQREGCHGRGPRRIHYRAYHRRNTNQLRQLIEANTALTETVAELSREIHKHVCTPEHTAR
ncbi:hypothetical protein [Rhodococcus qingshengii]|uniref:hypothetical protein n=1 Tax=Rhodococcus qingshengii TaxID=334542 RepID=UPI0024B8FFAC|nr:hypothetical protein [Rhodococcus qingshengii]MDJ0441456.1 hypothetical protein [Rhodococcus qingshengii]